MINHCQRGTKEGPSIVGTRIEVPTGEEVWGGGFPTRDRVWKGAYPLPRKKFPVFYLKTATFGASRMLLFTVRLPVEEIKCHL